VHDLGDGVDVQGGDMASLGDACVVHQEIDTTECIEYVHAQLIDCVEVGQVDHPHTTLG